MTPTKPGKQYICTLGQCYSHFCTVRGLRLDTLSSTSTSIATIRGERYSVWQRGTSERPRAQALITRVLDHFWPSAIYGWRDTFMVLILGHASKLALLSRDKCPAPRIKGGGDISRNASMAWLADIFNRTRLSICHHFVPRDLTFPPSSIRRSCKPWLSTDI